MKNPDHFLRTPEWYKDAVIYEVHIKAFCDSDGNGLGDFKGLRKKLDYLHRLGVTAIWILPFYPSPLRDDGYDIADYYTVHPDYGTLRDFKSFLNEAHDRGLYVITELVINHTSDKHPWFQRARLAKANSPERDFYVWNDTPDKYTDARIIFKDFERSNWTYDAEANAYYWHRFYSHQPDLNFDNPVVQDKVIEVLDYWFDMGVDGMRLDAIPYLYEREGTNCENLPETHVFLKRLRAHLDTKFAHRLLLAEANQWMEEAVKYFGDGDSCHMSFHFPLMPRMFMAVQMEDRFPIVEILEQTPVIPQSCQWGIFLRNHDELTLEMVTDEERDFMYRVYAKDHAARINLGIRRRLAPLMENNRRKVELINMLLFTLPGTPIVYYGDEIGMGDNYYLGDRNGVRTPMQWSSDKNAGFSVANPQRLYLPIIIDPEYHYEAVNVEAHEHNASSLLWWTRRVIAMRKSYAAFGRGSFELILGKNPKVLSYIRRYHEEILLVVLNLSRYPQAAELDLSGFRGCTPVEVFGKTEFPTISERSYVFTLNEFDVFCFELRSPSSSVTARETEILMVKGKPESLFLSVAKERLEQGVIQDFLERKQWFGSKTSTISNVSIEAVFPMTKAFFLLRLKVQLMKSEEEVIHLPVAIAEGEKAHSVREKSPNDIIARLSLSGKDAVMYHIADEEDVLLHFSTITKERNIDSLIGEDAILIALKKGKKRPASTASYAQLLDKTSHRLSFLLGQSTVIRFYYQAAPELSPDYELVEKLSGKQSVIPTILGAVSPIDERGVHNPIITFQWIPPNQGTAHKVLYDRLIREVGRVDNGANTSAKERLWNDYFADMLTQLGIATAEMHYDLATLEDTQDTPEAFTRLYQRSIYQAMRAEARRVFSTLKRNYDKSGNAQRRDISSLLSIEGAILSRYEAFLNSTIKSKKIRIHGNYTLHALFYTGKELVITDFDGKTTRAISERRLKRSFFRDAASLLLSLSTLQRQVAYQSGTSFKEGSQSDTLSQFTFWRKKATNTFVTVYLEQLHKRGLIFEAYDEYFLLLEVFQLELIILKLGEEIETSSGNSLGSLEEYGELIIALIEGLK